MNTAKVAALTLCAILFLAAVAEAVKHRTEGRLSRSNSKASTLKSWIQKRAELDPEARSKLKSWIQKRAVNFVAKLSKIASNLKLSLPWDNQGNLKDGKPFDQNAINKGVDALVTQLQNAPDDAFKPDASELQSSNADDDALLESADGMINPDEPLSTDVDNDILQAVDEEIKGASDPEDALIGYAGKALTRADAGTFMADNTDFENTPDDAHVDNPKSFLEIRETRARLLHRNREGGSRRGKDRAEVIDQFIKTLKKISMPKTISAGVGGNVGPFGSSIDLAFDMNAQNLSVVHCLSAVLGTDSIGVGANYHVQVGWPSESASPEGISVGVSGCWSFAAAGVPLSLGGALSWAADGITEAWKKFNDTINKAHTANKTLVEGSGGKFKIAMQTLQDKAKDTWKAATDLAQVAKSALPTLKGSWFVSFAVGVGISPEKIVGGADVTVSNCILVGKPHHMKLWKLIMGLFLVSGPAGAVAGLFSWMTYHTDVVKQKLEKLKEKFVKIKKAVSTFAKVSTEKMKNFWIAPVLAVTKQTIEKLKGVPTAVTTGLQKMKTIYFFPTNGPLLEAIQSTRQKLHTCKG